MTVQLHLFTLLLLGHVVSDLLVERRRETVAGRGVLRAVVVRSGWRLLAYAIALMPLFAHERLRWGDGGLWLRLLPALVLAQALFDVLTAAVERRGGGRSLRTFALAHTMHLGGLYALAAAALQLSAPSVVHVPAYGAEELATARAAVLLTAYVLCATFGSEIVRLTLGPLQPPEPADAGSRTDRRGHTIGVLERWLGLTFLLVDAWTGLAGIIAAKSIARFKDLEHRPFAEYYLVGTLTSLLVTVAIGAATVYSLRALT